MSDAKRYMDILDSTRKLDNILDKLSNISYSAFLYENNYLDHADAHYGIIIRTVIKQNLMRLFLENNFSQTSIIEFYSKISENAAISRINIEDPGNPLISDSKFYLGEDIEGHCEYFESIESELYQHFVQDYIYSEYSRFSLIKKALKAEYRLTKALDFALKRKYDTKHVGKLKELATYALQEFKECKNEKINSSIKKLSLGCDEVETLNDYYPQKIIINPCFLPEWSPSESDKDEILKLISLISEECIKKANSLDIIASDLHCTYELSLNNDNP